LFFFFARFLLGEPTMFYKALLIGLLTLSSGSAFAATPINDGQQLVVPDGQPEAGTVISVMSKRVLGSILSSSSDYAVVLKHIHGSREFGISSASEKIYGFS
jgi:hypothetical protein